MQRVNFRGSQTGIIQRLRTLRSDLRQPLGRPGRQSWHVDWRRAQWRHGWSSIRLHLEGHGHRSDDPHTRAVLRGPAEGHVDLRLARGILLPVTTSCPKSLQQGVTLMGRNTTGPLFPAPGELRCICAALQMTPTEDRRPRPLLVWPSHIMCKRANNNAVNSETGE